MYGVYRTYATTAFSNNNILFVCFFPEPSPLATPPPLIAPHPANATSPSIWTTQWRRHIERVQMRDVPLFRGEREGVPQLRSDAGTKTKVSVPTALFVGFFNYYTVCSWVCVCARMCERAGLRLLASPVTPTGGVSTPCL